jgi:hypothetical protein
MTPGRTGIKISIGLQCLAVAIIYLLANYLGFTHYERRDYSRSQKFSLADQTKIVLKEFKKPLNIIIVSSPSFLSPASQILGDIRSLMTEVLFNKRQGLVVEYVDPTRNLSRIQELQTKYNLTSLDNIAILDYDERHRLVNLAEMGDFDMSPVAQGELPILLGFRGEQILTSALMGLLKAGSQNVYFLQGHGEPPPTINGDLSTWIDAIHRQNAICTPLSLSSIDKVPEDAAAIVIAAAKSDLDEREAAVLAAWLRVGGKMLVLLDPNASTPRLHALLAANGIIPQDDRVLRLIKLPFAMGILRDVTGEVLKNAEVTRRLQGMNILFPGATQSLTFEKDLVQKEKILIRPLTQAAEEFWGETNFAPNQAEGVRYDDGIDHGQPVIIAALADRDGVEDDRLNVQTSRLIVVGSSQFAYDASISRPGLDLLIGSINYLVEQGNLSGITAKNTTRFALQLTDLQLSQLALVVMVGMPAAAAFLGLIVWWRRRA